MILMKSTHRKSAKSIHAVGGEDTVKCPSDEELLAALIPMRQHYSRMTDLGASGRLIEARVLDALKAPLTEAELEHIKYTAMHKAADVNGIYT